MANKFIQRINISSEKLLQLMEDRHVSIRELSRRKRIGYSERAIRAHIEAKKMSINMIMRICGELNLVFATCLGKGGEPYALFYEFGDPMIEHDANSIIGDKLTFWMPVLDPCGFEYPKKLEVPHQKHIL